MKKKNTVKIGALILTVAISASCASTKEQTQEEPAQTQREQPSVIEILTDMDADKDGRVSESEAKGPIKENFTTIDTDRDGFLTVEELKNAPKPEEGKRPEGGRPEGGRPGGGPPRN